MTAPFASPLLVAWLAASCASPADDVLLDLVAGFPQAVATTETRVIDFGTASAVPHLLVGFPAWTGASRALLTHAASVVVSVEVLVPRDVEVSLVARTEQVTRTGEADPARLRVFLNDVAVGDMDIGQRFAPTSLPAPGGLWRVGENRLEFRVGDEGDAAPRGVLWDALSFEPRPPFPQSAAEVRSAPRAQLRIPFGTRLDYYARARDGLRLEIDEIAAAGTAARLQVETFASDETGTGRSSPAAIDVARRHAGVSLPLPALGQGYIRLSLTALPSQDAASDGAVLLTGARLVAPPLPATTETLAGNAPAGPVGSPPSIVVFLVDTLRADRLGVHGYGRGTSPNIDRFAATATVFERAIAQSSWTKASVASVFTGLYPGAHGVTEHDSVLIDDAATLAEALAAAGYETAGIVTISTVASLFGFDQGFASYEELLEEATPQVHQPAGRVVDHALRWIDERADAQRPFFLYLHVADPHTPYMPPEDMRTRFAADVAPDDLGNFKIDLSQWQPTDAEVTALRDAASMLYDAEVAYVDAQFGRFLDGLQERGLADDIGLLLLADHGEEFFEHGGFTHGRTLYQEQLHVPMILRLPRDDAGRRIATTVRQVDVLPTLLQMAGVPLPASIQGASLLPLLSTPEVGRPALSQLRLGDLELDSVIDREWKLIATVAPGSGQRRFELFDLDSDPGELRDQQAGQPATRGYFAAWLARRLDELRAGALDVENAILDPEVTERLRALGYIR